MALFFSLLLYLFYFVSTYNKILIVFIFICFIKVYFYFIFLGHKNYKFFVSAISFQI